MNFVQYKNIKISLDINSTDEILECRYELAPKTKEQTNPVQLKYLSKVRRLVLNEKIDDVLSLDTLDYIGELSADEKAVPLVLTGDIPMINIPFWMVRKLLQNYKGDPLPFSHLKNKKDSELVCRCLGIYESEILAALKDETKNYLKVADLLNDLNLGMVCGSCSEDVTAIWQENYVVDPNKIAELEKQKSAIVSVVDLQKTIADWVHDQFDIHDELFVEIFDLNETELSLKINSNDPKMVTQIKSELPDFLNRKITWQD